MRVYSKYVGFSMGHMFVHYNAQTNEYTNTLTH